MIRVLLALLVLLTAAPARAMPLNDIQLAQGSRFPFDSTMTVKEAMDSFWYFNRVTWQVYYDINNRKVVEARGYFDMAKIKTRTDQSTCVTKAGVSVGLNDGQPFYILQYRPDFVKQKAEMIYSGLWGLYDEGRLDDQDLLWAKAIVTGELPSPTPLCNMKLDQLSAEDDLAIQEAPVTDPGAPKPATQTPKGTPRMAPDEAKDPVQPKTKSAEDVAKQKQEQPPVPTKTTR